MRVIHTADWHLSFRQFSRLTPDGLNVRERDVAVTFRRLIDRFITIAPDVIVVAGDIFHSPRPSNHAVVHANKQLRRLREALPDVIIVMVAGNHDSPKTSDTGSILPLFRELGVHVVDRGHQQLRFGELSILAVPDMIGIKRPPLEPDPTAKYNLLVLHGTVQGMPRRRGQRPADEIAVKAIGIEAWDYVSLGHFHGYTELAPNMFYSGSIDFTSSDPWSEIATPKGFVERDLATGEHVLHENPPSRAWVDLPRIELENPSPAAVDAAIANAVESIGGVDGKVVRLVVAGVPRSTRHSLDHAQIKSYEERAAEFKLDLDPPERIESALSMQIRGVTESNARGDMLGDPKAPSRVRRSMDELVAEKLATHTFDDEGFEINREAFVALGQQYNAEAREKISDTATTTEVEGTIAPPKAKRQRAKETAA